MYDLATGAVEFVGWLGGSRWSNAAAPDKYPIDADTQLQNSTSAGDEG